MTKRSAAPVGIPSSMIEEVTELVALACTAKRDESGNHGAERRDAALQFATALALLAVEDFFYPGPATAEEPGFEVPSLRVHYLATIMLGSSIVRVCQIGRAMLYRPPREQKAILREMESCIYRHSSNPTIH